MSSEFESVVSWLRRPLQFHSGDIWGPPQYTNWVEEEMSWKTTCYLGDWSFLRSLRYKGPDVFRLFADCSVNSMNNFEIGRSKHVIHTNDDGKLIEEGVLTRTGEEECIAYGIYHADHVRRKGDYDVEMEPIEEVKYQLQGPNALLVLEKLLGSEFRDIKFMRNSTKTLAGVETRILRQGMSGEIGFELQAATAEGPKLYEAILEAGQEYGIKQMGGRVAQLNHLQAAYPTNYVDYLPAVFNDKYADYYKELREAGREFDNIFWAINGSFDSDDISDYYRSPVEFGWGNRINFDHKFPGDEALRAELENPKRRLSTLRWNSDDIVDVFSSFFREDGELPDFMEMPQDPRGYVNFDKILSNGELVGQSSNRGYSAYFREMISLAVVDIELAEPGNEVTVVWGNPGTPQREIRAVTASAPYKQDRGRVDLKTLPTR